MNDMGVRIDEIAAAKWQRSCIFLYLASFRPWRHQLRVRRLRVARLPITATTVVQNRKNIPPLMEL